MEDFATVLENFEAEQKEVQQQATEERVVKGTVVKITDKHVVVDFGSKSEGLVPLEQVKDHEGNAKFQPGDEIEVMPDGDGKRAWSSSRYEKAQRLKVWDDIEKAHNEKTPVKGIVIEPRQGRTHRRHRRHGVPARLASRDAALRNLDGYEGPGAGSTRHQAEQEARQRRGLAQRDSRRRADAELRSKTLEHLEEGAILTGTVKNLTDYGAFVDLGGLDGLLHITDMSWGRLTHPRDLVHVGDEIQVKVLKFDKDKQRVSLGFKQLTPDPWLDAVGALSRRRAR